MLDKTIWIFTDKADLEVLEQTDKAYLVLVQRGPNWFDGRQTWIPKSALLGSVVTHDLAESTILRANIAQWFWHKLHVEYATLLEA